MKRSDKALLKKALYDSEAIRIKRLEMLPRVTGEHSEKYKKRLEEIFNSFDDIEKKNKRRSKRKTFLIAAIIALLALSFSACAVIEPVRDFVIEIYEKCTNIFLTSENIGELNQKFELSYIPERYELNESSIFDDAGMYEKRYDYGEKSISLMMVNGSSISSYDSEGIPMKDVYINGIQIYLFTKWSNDIAVWTDGEYLFTLSYPEDLDFSEVEKMILSVAPISE